MSKIDTFKPHLSFLSNENLLMKILNILRPIK